VKRVFNHQYLATDKQTTTGQNLSQRGNMQTRILSLCGSLLLAASALATTISSDVTYRMYRGPARVFNPAITSVSAGFRSGNDARVPPGATITMTGNWAALPAEPGGNPGAIVETYIAWIPPAAANGATPVNVGLWIGGNPVDGQVPAGANGPFTFTTHAPTVPGTYYVGFGSGPDYYFIPTHPGGTGIDTATGTTDVASFRITVTIDMDDDGVVDAVDQCPGTPAGSVVDAHGCSIAQYCPCEATPPATWPNHGQYVSCVARISDSFLMQNLITLIEKGEITSTAARSACGVK
jgi:hypothetical protein